ncbi:hypothetical protein A2313_03410 [Candidatus Roizmanbacteria bacterium RIFOXYB2_FULL_41_10]|uniref:Uncharacterized protein n=1 Tax=Candidatus Roizmanbacteria bacterium RIFOXYA1_FULL_41_12 TaxID=1802082 RepID=A0A1F7KGP0_9BACT|nr:MAG: hypothetical protein A2262_01945 [Candidatus Roizmanbacteria bacterium RIFOXYA2_FULL_41_8]OGK67043.1 MAG: hypothetical protein A2209_03245 [Candidatus Roizmanbacteria bacterium RIFOXYA1_FULL_41_12]OGK71663.1 MAG: hypothetical protein A2403_04350 [Candidatus Roizmanbacteria bacterium RIFOXYC1_FULL_41_16]OGK72132.1 MAG: hypothetical protein A2313_03410 [Candidatus Roizmanbacteria bacterium RIFOXYB2_FULL_41_10]OGK75043.1 MAG: hypothetical protein A2575_03925 [Candidatus Roizmanbacteria bac
MDAAILLLKDLNWLSLVFKIIALIFSVGYLVYSIIYQQQLVKMEKNALIYYHLLNHPGSSDESPHSLLFSFSMLQLFIGIVLIIISLFLI